MNARIGKRADWFFSPAIVALLLCAVWIYTPGIAGPELLDDRSSVLVIGDLQESPELIWDTIFGDSSGLLGRSVSMSTFVLEKLYLNQGIAGGKKVNIILHACNGGLVIWLLTLLFRWQNIAGYRWLALLLGGVWLLHPLFVSTVLYVVQRMAMLATFFMLLSSISYVYWRQSLNCGVAGWLRFLPVLLFFALAMLSKENAIVLIPTLLLVEVLWLQSSGNDGQSIRWLQKFCYSLIGAGALALSGFVLFGYGYLADRFTRRPFSLDERLLTQGRIVWDYLGQLFYPQMSRLGLYHDDVIVSESLRDPLTTSIALAAWVALLLVCTVLLRWRPGRLIVLGIAWFIIGHSVESTVLPLEMYFEHRNYFPAIGIALCVGAAYGAFIRRWPEPGRPLLVILAMWLVFLSAQTSSQVQIWSNRSLLILNHLNGHPQSARANNDMAVLMANRGEYEAALKYSKRGFAASANKASTNERLGDYQIRDLALSCSAKKAPPPGLIESLGEVDPNRPLSSVSTLLTMVRHLQNGNCPELDRVAFADRMAEVYLSDDQRRGALNIYSSLAVLENALGRFDNAFAYAERVLRKSPTNRRGLLMKLHFATALQKDEAVAEAVSSLKALKAQGKLDVEDQQTLALYLE